MDALNLLTQARAAGLKLTVAGDHLKVAGPKSAAAFVRELSEHKAAILAALLTAPTCADCGQPLASDSGPNWRHSWCPAGCSDKWEALAGGSLGASGAPLPGTRLSLFAACCLDCETDDDGRVWLAERAGIMEFDDGLSRAEAEERAAREWLERAAGRIE